MKLHTKKYIQSILLFIILISIFISIFISFPLNPYDELWNFQNVFKMYNGYKIYNESNVIVTPIFFVIANLFFKIFSANLITFRMYNILSLILLYYSVYNIFKTLNIKKSLCKIYTFLIMMHTIQLFFVQANYNILAIFTVFCAIFFHLKYYKKNMHNIIQGIFIFLIFFIKQNIGVYYFIAIIVFELIEDNISIHFFKNQFIKLLFFLIPSIIALFILYLNNNFFNFVNYTFGGLFEFGHSNFKFSSSIFPVALCVFSLFTFIVILKNKKILIKNSFSTEEMQHLTFFICIAVFMTLSAFPIINTIHMIIVLFFYMIPLLYFFDRTIIKDITNTEKSDIIINWISIIMLIFIPIKFTFGFYSDDVQYTKINDPNNPFYNIYIETEYVEKIKTMSQYIKNKNKSGIDVIIIASDSALTMVPLNQNHGEFDLVFYGNLGYNGINNLIEKIKNSENTEYLIYTDEEDMFWQEPTEIREFIINNLTKTGEICNYSIYK